MRRWSSTRRLVGCVVFGALTACAAEATGDVSETRATAGSISGRTDVRSPTSAADDRPSSGVQGGVVTDPTTTAPEPLPDIRLDVERTVEGFAGIRQLTGGEGQNRYVVTSSANGGDGTYRHALRGGQRHITFDPSLDGETIVLDEPVIAPGSDITIDGSGVDVTISGSATRFSGTNIVIAGLTYSNFDETDDEDAVTFLDASETQVLGIFNNRFSTATDGLVDLIWNRGNDVYATICGNRFERHDKAMLIHSGREGREGGRYHVTLCRNEWNDTYQRTPLSRNADVHQYNSVFSRFGKPNGEGGGSKAGGERPGDTQHFLESNVAIPRSVGEVTFDGSVVSSPRREWAGPQAGGDGSVKTQNTLLATSDGVAATETEQDPDLVFDPPYPYDVVESSAALLEIIRSTAGTCIAAEVDSVNPCAALVLVQNGTTVTATVTGTVDRVQAQFDGVVVGDADDLGDGRWTAEISGRPGQVATLTMVATTSDGRSVTSEPILVGVVDRTS